ncbi:hypothetical protein B0A52_07873 [Exophiala mesophila]|uniref:DUF4387 domain-containing protein n=1 Tax=Exophiala mesophila TaxID=212818 RepID=A0A438MXS9_EXOME|nr:hypothetical protein B0A52_07873 [Exophiala mesophila]
MAPSAVFEEPIQAAPTSLVHPICQIVTPVGMFGYGFSEEWTEAALAKCVESTAPTAIILDAGSTDSGPTKLALGTTTCPYDAYERDFRKLIPLSMKSWKLKAISIYSQLNKSLVHERFKDGQISPCGKAVPELTEEAITQTPRIVAQMGPEPFLDAIIRDPDFHVMIGGRAYDPAPYVAFAAYHALDSKQRDITNLSSESLGSIYHMGKVLECGGLCATPKGSGAIGIVNSDFSVDIRPLDPAAKCIPLSVAAHTMYEKSRPDLLAGPGGVLDVSTATYTQLEDSITTRISGSKFYLSRKNGEPFTVKLEGARVTGYRTLMMGSFGDPILIGQINNFLERAKQYAYSQNGDVQGDCDIGFHIYGFDKDKPEYVPSQIFVVTETLAPTQKAATSLASAMRIAFAHGPYPGQKATSGNFGMGIGGKLELEVDQCAEFSLYHLMKLADGEQHGRETSDETSNGLFRWSSTLIGDGELLDYQLQVVRSDKIFQPATPKAKSVNGFPAPPDVKLPSTLFDIAKVVRSKNAGPFEVTLDVMFDNRAVYETVKASGILGRDVIAQLYKIPAEDIIWEGFFDPAMAYKATVPRRRRGLPSCSGGFLEDDVHGSQLYSPLQAIPLTEELISKLRKGF